MFAGDSSFGEDSIEMIEIMMLSTCKGYTHVSTHNVYQLGYCKAASSSTPYAMPHYEQKVCLLIEQETSALKQSHNHAGRHQGCAV